MWFQDGGKRRTMSYTWFRGEHCNIGHTSDHAGSCRSYAEYFLKDSRVASPVIYANTRITVYGRCFAANFSAFPAANKYHIHSPPSLSRVGFPQLANTKHLVFIQ
jgi:hypothetical protein